jgi:ribosomal protein L30E
MHVVFRVLKVCPGKGRWSEQATLLLMERETKKLFILGNNWPANIKSMLFRYRGRLLGQNVILKSQTFSVLGSVTSYRFHRFSDLDLSSRIKKRLPDNDYMLTEIYKN